ncbi:MAG: hypothetical protein H7Y03_00895 [Chitinophagaceae bacterium]|nr:hypothetical protein [Chitinophagaceae bacterium]
MISFKKLFIASLCLGTALFSSCGKELSTSGTAPEDSASVALVLSHSVRTLPLNYIDEYITDGGETYKVSRFRYYIHDIELISKAGVASKVLPGYFLVNQDEPASRRFSFNAPAGSYSSIAFTLGVDSADNMSGAQAGALDPANGMFWTWSSGYVMAKLEGTSPFVTGASNNFTYHIGGYKAPDAVIKKINIPVTEPNSLNLVRDTSVTLNVSVDINTWFSRVHDIEMALTPACHSPGELAKKIAENYEGMFSLKNIE